METKIEVSDEEMKVLSVSKVGDEVKIGSRHFIIREMIPQILVDVKGATKETLKVRCIVECHRLILDEQNKV